MARTCGGLYHCGSHPWPMRPAESGLGPVVIDLGAAGAALGYPVHLALCDRDQLLAGALAHVCPLEACGLGACT